MLAGTRWPLDMCQKLLLGQLHPLPGDVINSLMLHCPPPNDLRMS